MPHNGKQIAVPSIKEGGRNDSTCLTTDSQDVSRPCELPESIYKVQLQIGVRC